MRFEQKIPANEGPDFATPNVLFVSTAAPPKGSPESLQVGKYLKYLVGYPIDVYLVTEAVPKKQRGWSNMEKKYQSVLTSLKQVIEVPLYRRQISALLRRVNTSVLPVTDDALLFTKATRKVRTNLVADPDIIYSRSTPFSSAVLAMKLKRIYQVPWIMHLSDPWVVSPFFKAGGTYENYHRKLEQQCFERADKISFTSRDQIALYENEYPRFKSKFIWFPNVFDDEEVAEESVISHGKIRFLHTGNFYGPGRSPEPFLRALENLYNSDKHCLDHVDCIFAGRHEKSVDEIFRKYKSIPVRHIGVLSQNEVLQLQRDSQVLIIIDWELPQEKAVFLLSKAVDYMAARKSMLAITTRESTIHKFVEGVYGRCFEHHDIEGIAGHIRYLIDDCGKNDKPVQVPYQVDMNYSASKNAQRLFELLQNLKMLKFEESQ